LGRACGGSGCRAGRERLRSFYVCHIFGVELYILHNEVKKYEKKVDKYE
jgi:hypothetical protein